MTEDRGPRIEGRGGSGYRLGVGIVGGVIVAAALVAPRVPRRASTPAGQDLERHPLALGAFRLVERSGRVVTDADLAGRVWIAGFIFTRCRTSCPAISAVMKRLQGELAGTGVRLVSISVDPDHDSPAALAAFARRYGADPDGWWFLTGSKGPVHRLIRDRFRLGVVDSDPSDRAAGAEEILHSSRLALVDRRNRVVGYFDSNDARAVAQLAEKASRLGRAWVHRLPALNAALNASCAALLAIGWCLIRAGRVRAHIVSMASGLVVSALFLASYLVYHSRVGSVPFRGEGPIRAAYFTVLLSHTVLAAAIVPLVTLTVARAVRSRFAEHARIARITFPIWLYVSVSGVIVYAMLYHLDVPSQGLSQARTHTDRAPERLAVGQSSSPR